MTDHADIMARARAAVMRTAENCPGIVAGEECPHQTPDETAWHCKHVAAALDRLVTLAQTWGAWSELQKLPCDFGSRNKCLVPLCPPCKATAKAQAAYQSAVKAIENAEEGR